MWAGADNVGAPAGWLEHLLEGAGPSLSKGGAYQVVEKFHEGGVVCERHWRRHSQATALLAAVLKTPHGTSEGDSLLCGAS